MQGACQNCGGAGVVVAFIATEGPYDAPAHPYMKRGDTRLTSKSDIINGQIKFWVGQTISVACPDCQNTLAPVAVTPGHVFHPATKKLAGKFDVSGRNEWQRQDSEEE
jgi:hypothetical protein